MFLGVGSSESEKTTNPTTVNQETAIPTPTENSGPTSIKNMDKSKEGQQMIQKRRKELENVTPIDQAKFESWIPETLWAQYKGHNSLKIKTILEDRYILSATGYKMYPYEL